MELDKVLAEEAYDISQGGFSHIAIVDTGVDGSHSDLSGIVLTGYNTIDENTDTTDGHGHGTHVAGIAAGITNNTVGIASISYVADILPVKVLNDDGVGTYDDVSEGIIYAADQESRIINLSLGGSSDSETLKRAVTYAGVRGSLLVAAAGNSGNDAPMYPAAYDGVLAVSASDQNDDLASFSSYGSNIFVAAPGVSITSSVPGDNYRQYNGTSMAAPHLAGLIALSLAYMPELANAEIIDEVKQNADKVGDYAYDENGWNPYFGYGRINAGSTLLSLEEDTESSPSPTPTTAPITDTSRLPKSAQVPQQYQFTFELQGTVSSVELGESKFTVLVEGGTPEVMQLISGYLVDIYVNSQTRIKYQGRDIALSELLANSRVNVKGNVSNNRLIALEILMQYTPLSSPWPTIMATPKSDNQPSNKNEPDDTHPPQSNNQTTETNNIPQQINTQNNPPPAAQNQSGQGKGAVKGVVSD